MKLRPRRWPSYIGVVYWGVPLALLAFAALNSGVGWGLVFGAAWLALVTACLWFYGVIPVRRGSGSERA